MQLKVIVMLVTSERNRFSEFNYYEQLVRLHIIKSRKYMPSVILLN